MNTGIKIFVLLLGTYAEGGPQMADVKTSLEASVGDETYTYQHKLACPQHSTITVVGGEQFVKFNAWGCTTETWSCDHGCCKFGRSIDCTVDMVQGILDFHRQTCIGHQNCSVKLARAFVKCGLLKKDLYYSVQSTVHFRCDIVADPTHPSMTDAPKAASQFPESSEYTTETLTSPRDVSEETMKSSSNDATKPMEVTPTTDSWTMSTRATNKDQVGVTDERGKGGSHSGKTPATSAAVGGAAAGAVTLLALSITLLLCWCRRRSKANAGEKVSRGAANPIYDISMDFLDDPVRPSAPQGEVTSAQSSTHSTAADTDYDHLGAKTARVVRPHDGTYGHLDEMDDEACYDRAGAKGKRDVISNVYDSARPVEMSEEDPYDVTTRSSRPDVVNDVYDVAGVPRGAGSDEENVFQDNGSSTGTKELFEDTRSLEHEEVLESTYENF